MGIVTHFTHMLQYGTPGPRVALLGRGAMVAQRTLNPYILVRIRAPQPVPLYGMVCVRRRS